ncbi:MAG: hypothetical protein HY721_03755 [Planctomycetes bacterium]|nr:hypothetical protein [Planctomycetota bacterium]
MLLKLVALGEADIRAGRTMPQKKAFAKAAAAIRRARHISEVTRSFDGRRGLAEILLDRFVRI